MENMKLKRKEQLNKKIMTWPRKRRWSLVCIGIKTTNSILILLDFLIICFLPLNNRDKVMSFDFMYTNS